MDHGYEHGEHLDDDIIADNEEVSNVQEISDDEELSDEIESLNDEEVSGEDTSDDDEHSDESPPVENDEISDDEMSDDDDLYNESTNNEIMSQIESDDPNLTILMVGGSFYPPDGDWAGLGRAIGRNTHLKEIVCLSGRSLMKEYCNDLSCGLASNQYIQNLALSNDLSNGDNIDDEVANILANGIIRNAPLKKLGIQGANDISHIGWLEIFAALQMNPNCRLEELNLYSNIINEAAVLSLLNVILRHTTTLKTLHLTRSIDDITIAGWGALFHSLQDPLSRLENLSLRRNSITDEVATALGNALANNSRLRELDLSWIQHVTIAGWQALFRPLLQNPNSVLVKLELSDSHITDEVAAALTIALANNSSLRELDLSSNPVSYDGYAAFTHTLCNDASILSTYQSNHSLAKLSNNVRSLPENLISLLRINRENSTSQAARIKIIKTHFSGSDINTQVFADMEVHVRPTAIAWMGRDGGSDGNGDLLFAFLRSMPLLCDTKSKS